MVVMVLRLLWLPCGCYGVEIVMVVVAWSVEVVMVTLLWLLLLWCAVLWLLWC